MSNSYNIEVGKKIHNRRKELKMSMKTLGEKVNLHESTVSRYEKGEIQSLDIEKIKEFAKALDVSIADLVDWKDRDHSISSTIYLIARKLGAGNDLSFEEVLDELNIILDSNKEKEHLSENLRTVQRHKEWYEQVGEFEWSDKEYEFLMNAAIFIKEIKPREDSEQLLDLAIQLFKQLTK